MSQATCVDSMEYYTLPASFLIFIPFFLLILKQLIPKSPNLPPGPLPWPLLGNILQIGKSPHISLAQLAKIHGPLISVKLGTQLVVVASSPDSAAEILKTQDRLLSVRSVPKVATYELSVIDQHSIVFSSDLSNHWKFLRAFCRTYLFSPKAVESQTALREKKELISAGSDTTTSTIEWAMAELLRNKGAMHKLQAELTSKIGENDIITESNITELPYLAACVKEALRIHPPTPFLIPRRAPETCKIMDYTIPKNSRLFVNVWAIGRDSNTWEDALSFRPERFLDSSVDFRGQDFEFIPFGAGRRICPGLPFARQEVHLILANLIHHFEWSLPNGEDPMQIDMKENHTKTPQICPPVCPKAAAEASSSKSVPYTLLRRKVANWRNGIVCSPLEAFLKGQEKSRNLPLGPRSWPLLGNILQIGNKPHISLAQFAKIHGPLISVRLGTQLVVVASSPETTAEILKTQDRLLSARSVPSVAPYKLSVIDQHSMVWSSDLSNHWKFLRAFCWTHLFSPKAVESQAALRKKKVSEMIDFLSSRKGKTVKISEILFGAILNTLGNLFFSKYLCDLDYETSTSGIKLVIRK
ncbi:hypothetical protein RDI58_007866 [Solanum bulbocastanum]|uniref:Uncharacterized protein n=1 Tax=Solanum bulbocastanum TaxID=147425 RepID=A0AAN8YMK4_SOLBU